MDFLENVGFTDVFSAPSFKKFVKPMLSMNFVLAAKWFENHGFLENVGFTNVFRLHLSTTLVEPMFSMNFVI